MFTETPVLRLAKFSRCFPGRQLKLILASLEEENTEGQLWTAPQSLNECLVLFWDKGKNVIYIAGKPVSPEHVNELSRLLMDKIRELAIEAGLTDFMVCMVPPWDESVLPELLPGINLQQVERLLYSLEVEHPSLMEMPDVPGLEFVNIDKKFLASSELEDLEPVKAELNQMWTPDGMRRGKEFGIAALVDKRIICWCTAEYVSQDWCGFRIETLPEYENRGVGSATAARFVEHCQQRGLRPYWECDKDNHTLLRVIEKVGFQLLSEQTCWRGQFS